MFKTTLLCGVALVFGAASLQAQPKKDSGPKSQPVAVTGIVAGAPQGREFNLRATGGQIWRINIHSGANLKNVRGGDRVRVFGKPLGTKLFYCNVRVLRRGASDSPDDYAQSGGG